MSEISQNQRRGGPEALAANHALIREADGNMREMLTQYKETTSELLELAGDGRGGGAPGGGPAGDGQPGDGQPGDGQPEDAPPGGSPRQ